jgi:hypothetical protein
MVVVPEFSDANIIVGEFAGALFNVTDSVFVAGVQVAPNVAVQV